MKVIALVACIVFSLTGCSVKNPISPKIDEKILTIEVSADPAAGFNYSYLLRFPNNRSSRKTYLLVEPNNSGFVSDNLDDHKTAARRLSESGVGAFVSDKLDIPLLVSVFPRPEEPYTHILNRRTLVSADKQLHRLDLQLIAMIADARRRLSARGTSIQENVLLTGFSASGAFVNRFTALHPEAVKAYAAGGVNGLLLIPDTKSDSTVLPYPLGTADFVEITGQAFKREIWAKVPQFLYMGSEDTNDAVQFDDAYTDDERRIIYTVLGERMQPDRWQKTQDIYVASGAKATFRTYAETGHGTNRKINTEIVDFFKSTIE